MKLCDGANKVTIHIFHTFSFSSLNSSLLGYSQFIILNRITFFTTVKLFYTNSQSRILTGGYLYLLAASSALWERDILSFKVTLIARNLLFSCVLTGLFLDIYWRRQVRCERETYETRICLCVFVFVFDFFVSWYLRAASSVSWERYIWDPSLSLCLCLCLCLWLCPFCFMIFTGSIKCVVRERHMRPGGEIGSHALSLNQSRILSAFLSLFLNRSPHLFGFLFFCPSFSLHLALNQCRISFFNIFPQLPLNQS